MLIVKTSGHSHIYMYGCLYNRVDEVYKGDLDNDGLTITSSGEAKVLITNKTSSSRDIYYILL